MRNPKSMFVIILAVFFLCFGLLWLAAIAQRCGMIQCTVQGSIELSGGETTPPASLIDGKQYMRSPYARDNFFFLFWGLTAFEVASALAYLLAGFSLLRKFYFSRNLALAALVADIMFKLMTVAYMYSCAVPLARVTKNENILVAYYLAGKGFWRDFSALVSGMMFYQKSSFAGFLLYALLWCGLFYFLTRKNVGAARKKA